MNEVPQRLDLGEFAAWLERQRGDAEATEGPKPRSEHLGAAEQVWAGVREGVAELGRLNFRALKLAAADGEGTQAPMELRIEQGRIEFMRIGTTECWRIVFLAEPNSIDALKGRTPKVHIGGETIALSPIDNRGRARVDLPEGVEPGALFGFELGE